MLHSSRHHLIPVFGAPDGAGCVLREMRAHATAGEGDVDHLHGNCEIFLDYCVHVSQYVGKVG